MAARRFRKNSIAGKEAALLPELIHPNAQAASTKSKDVLKGQRRDLKSTKGPRLGLVVSSSVVDGVYVGRRLSDASMRKQVAATVKKVSGNRDAALRLLQDIGVATSTGRLSKRFGG